MVRQLVADVERQVGPIRGIVHGAGYESACRFEKRRMPDFHLVVQKLLGLNAL